MLKTLKRTLCIVLRGDGVTQLQELSGLPSNQAGLVVDGNLLAGKIEHRKQHHRVGKNNFSYYSLK